MTPDLAMIYLFAGNFAPAGYATCDGQILPISQNTALFSLIGTSYGGNGQTTFGLPDLRGRVPKHVGQGPGLSGYVLGQMGGTETTTLSVSQIPSHSHAVNVNNAAGTTATPGSTTYLSAGPSTGSGPNASALKTYTTVANNASLIPNTIGATGGGQPFSILSPYLTITYVIALVGVFPSRN
ncbi:phage tail protein [uncultured Mucilaginibacter sp.]|uniref:phage tail protein n=1 Tax=uncultured Mucilaginibacter sp. TaxID=797541 RepID=UPI0025F0CED2|nr:tail fiber protein [uncultured Mucilaginibacter sp.]